MVRGHTLLPSLQWCDDMELGVHGKTLLRKSAFIAKSRYTTVPFTSEGTDNGQLRDETALLSRVLSNVDCNVEM